MNIAIFNTMLPEPNRKPGGVDVAVHRLANALADRDDAAVTVFSLSPEPAEARYQHRQLFKDQLWLRHNPAGRLFILPWLLNSLDLSAFDVVHLHGDDWFYLRRPIPSVRTFHGTALWEARSATSLRRKLVQRIIYPMEVQASRLATLSVTVDREAAAFYDTDLYVDNGVDVERFSPGEKTEVPTVLFVGTWEGRKRGRFLYEAFTERVLPQLPEARLIMVSDQCPPHPQVDHMKAPDDDALAALYRQAWVFAIPSIYEGFGIPYLEAMASGTAVITSPNSGARHVLDQGAYGILADDRSFGDQLVQLLTHDAERSAFAERGLGRSEQFTWARVAEQHMDVYRKAIATRGVRAMNLPDPSGDGALAPAVPGRPASAARRPRLCFVIETGTDVRLVEGLTEYFDLTLIARPVDGQIKISQEPSRAVSIVEGPASRLEFAQFVTRYLWQHRGQVDFVITQNYGLTALATNLTCRSAGIASAMLVCSPAEAYYRCRQAHPEPDRPFRVHELWAMQIVARLNALVGERYLVLSQYLAGVVRGHGARGTVHEIPLYGVDTEIFAPPERPKQAVKAELGLPETGHVIFFSSRVAAEKDAETLLAAFRRLLDEGRDLWLLHRSGGYLRFVEDARRFGVDHRVIATDAVHPHRELPLDYQASDLCVQSSREEGLGFSPLEALACGVPVVASAVGGLRETIVPGRTGWTYPVGDVAALAEAIREVVDHPEEATRRADAGRALVQARYDRVTVFEKLYELVEKTVQERGGAVVSAQMSREQSTLAGS